jgi:S-adenosylmethionine synthetase
VIAPVILSRLEPIGDVEIVERKGIGHPDTICDALAEELSRNLCREYQSRYGKILHHNVDKGLLCGGASQPAFGGGAISAPIRLFLAGRATIRVGNDVVPVGDIAVEGTRAWLKKNLHALDPVRDVIVETIVQPGSQDLQELFSRAQANDTVPSNDTSFGVGYAPSSALERLVIEIERRIHARDRLNDHPAWGEDIKIMAMRRRQQVSITIACAMIGRYLPDIGSYLVEQAALADLVRACAREAGFSSNEVMVNAADDPGHRSVYLTVSGTSAEAGDDGQVGRGNRVNGLITPNRPMSLEAAAGKNPVSHVGKIYNVLARQIAETIVANIAAVEEAHCLMVSQIGAPISLPALVQVKLATKDSEPPERYRKQVEQFTTHHLSNISCVTAGLAEGTIAVF